MAKLNILFSFRSIPFALGRAVTVVTEFSPREYAYCDS